MLLPVIIHYDRIASDDLRDMVASIEKVLQKREAKQANLFRNLPREKDETDIQYISRVRKTCDHFDSLIAVKHVVEHK